MVVLGRALALTAFEEDGCAADAQVIRGPEDFAGKARWGCWGEGNEKKTTGQHDSYKLAEPLCN